VATKESTIAYTRVTYSKALDIDTGTMASMYQSASVVAAQQSLFAKVQCAENEIGQIFSCCAVLHVKNALELMRPLSVDVMQTVPLGRGIIGNVVDSGNAVSTDRPAEHPFYEAEIDGDNTKTFGAGTEEGQPSLFIPIVAADADAQSSIGRVIGVVRTSRSSSFSAAEEQNMLFYCRLIAHSLELSFRVLNLDKDKNEAVSKLAALINVANALASESSMDAVVQVICTSVPSLMSADRCTLFLADRGANELIVRKGASDGRSTGDSFGNNEIRMPIDTGIAGAVLSSGQLVNIPDVYDDDRFNKKYDLQTGYRTRSMLCVPMMNPHTGLAEGVIQVLNKSDDGVFQQADEKLLGVFCQQAVLAVNNARLLETLQRNLKQSDALLEVTHQLTGDHDTIGLINRIVSRIQGLLNAGRCTAFIVDPDDKTQLYTSEKMSFGMGPPIPIDKNRNTRFHFPIDRGLAGGCATSGKVINLADAYTDPRFNQKMDKETGFRTKSVLCVPVRINDGEPVVGVIQAMNKQTGGAFTKSDMECLQAFSAHTAIAISNSHLFQSTENALNHALAVQRNLKFMLSVSKNLFASMHVASLVDQIKLQVHNLMSADDSVVYLVSHSAKVFYATRAPDVHFPFSCGIAGHVISTGHSVLICENAFQDSRFDAHADQRPGKVTHSILCCPIVANDLVIGVISVRDESDKGGFGEGERNVLKGFCGLASVALANSRQFESVLERKHEMGNEGPATAFLRERGMHLGSEDIEKFQFTRTDIKVNKLIGKGSYGEVYLATLVPKDNREVAVKRLYVGQMKAEHVEAFCAEASLMCQLRHKNVVEFIGAVTEPANLCLITQYCAKGSLSDLLANKDTEMNFARKIQLAIDAAEGMWYLHSSNPSILHRDLKSDNLLVCEDWTAMVSDFGLTRFLNREKKMTGVGTPMWMAPEIILGKQYTEKADVYAYGIILWEILTRMELYSDKEVMQIVVEVVNNSLRPELPDFAKDSPLVPLMEDCWAADPNMRPTFDIILDRLQTLKSIAGTALGKTEYGV